MLVFVACLQEKEIIFGELWRKVSRKQSYSTKIFNHSIALFWQPSVTKRRQIEACHILKRNQSFFLETILYSSTDQTRDYGSHLWKLPRSQICSRIQLCNPLLFLKQIDFLYKLSRLKLAGIWRKPCVLFILP